MMGEIKDGIIKILGGYTQTEWNNALLLPRHWPVRALWSELVERSTTVRIKAKQWANISQEERKDIIKSEVIRDLIKDVDQDICYTVQRPGPETNYEEITVIARLRVLRPPEGGMIEK